MTAGNVSVFFFRDVNHSTWKVGKTTGMIGIAVGQNDVSNVVRIESKRLDAANGCVEFVELEARHLDKRLSQSLNRVANVL